MLKRLVKLNGKSIRRATLSDNPIVRESVAVLKEIAAKRQVKIKRMEKRKDGRNVRLDKFPNVSAALMQRDVEFACAIELLQKAKV